MLVALEGGSIVGYIHVLTHPAFHANGHIGWVEEVMVADDVRGSGYGRALMESAEDWARERSGIAYLAVATRRADPFYNAVGYQPPATYFKKAFR